MVSRQVLNDPQFLQFEPSLDDLSLRSDVISSIKILSLQEQQTAPSGEDPGALFQPHSLTPLSARTVTYERVVYETD